MKRKATKPNNPRDPCTPRRRRFPHFKNKRAPRNSYESRDARAALPQNCSIRRLSSRRNFENGTSVPEQDTDVLCPKAGRETYLGQDTNEILLCRVKPTSVPRQPNCSSEADRPEVPYGERI